jgi:hypothetical protein
MAVAGLASNETILGVDPCAKHHSLLASYLFNFERGPAAVRNMIIADLRSFLELGASRRAADLLIVLRLFFSKHPEAGYGPRLRLVKGTGRELGKNFKKSDGFLAPADGEDHAGVSKSPA